MKRKSYTFSDAEWSIIVQGALSEYELVMLSDLGPPGVSTFLPPTGLSAYDARVLKNLLRKKLVERNPASKFEYRCTARGDDLRRVYKRRFRARSQ